VLKQRILSAFVMLVIFLVVNFMIADAFFALAMCALGAAAAWEWSRVSGVQAMSLQCIYAIVCIVISVILVVYIPPPQLSPVVVKSFALAAFLFWMSVVYLFYSKPEKSKLASGGDVFTLIVGLFLISACVYFSHFLHAESLGGSAYLFLYAMCTVWVMDVGAYFTGKRFGRRKLAPRISPGKTWEGVFGGLACAALLAASVLALADFAAQKPLAFVLGTVLAAAVSILGDLYESRLKRSVGFKDSSQLIPGHGGVLDRIDGVIAAIPVFAFAWVWL